MTGSTILCDVSTGTPHPLVPTSWCRTMFDSLRALSHPGIWPTPHLLTARYVWLGIMQHRCPEVGMVMPPVSAVESAALHNYPMFYLCNSWMYGLTKSISTSLDHFSPQKATPSSPHVLTGSHIGQRPFPFWTFNTAETVAQAFVRD